MRRVRRGTVRATVLRAPSAAAGAQRALVAHMHPCTHAARTCMPRSRPNHMHPGTSSVADQRTRATWEARCISARCRRRCAEDECTCWCSARRPLLVADRFVHGRGPWPCTNRVAESRHGRTAACEVHPTSVTKRSVPRIRSIFFARLGSYPLFWTFLFCNPVPKARVTKLSSATCLPARLQCKA